MGLPEHHYTPNGKAVDGAATAIGVPFDLARRVVVAYMDVLHGKCPGDVFSDVWVDELAAAVERASALAGKDGTQ